MLTTNVKQTTSLNKNGLSIFFFKMFREKTELVVGVTKVYEIEIYNNK